MLPLNLCYKLYWVQTLGSGSSSRQKKVHPVGWSRGVSNTVAWYSCMCSLQVAGLETALGTEHHWAMMLSLSLIPALTQYLVLPFCPESPRYLLINRGEESKAEAGGSHDPEVFTQLITLNKPRMWILRRQRCCWFFLPMQPYKGWEETQTKCWLSWRRWRRRRPTPRVGSPSTSSSGSAATSSQSSSSSSSTWAASCPDSTRSLFQFANYSVAGLQYLLNKWFWFWLRPRGST